VKIFKRADFWILLALVGGLVGYFVFSGKPVVPGGVNHRFSVKEIALRRDYGNFLASFRIDYDNREGKTFDPALEAKLLAGGERAIPGYFLATDARVPVEGGKKSELTLKYWLEAADLGGSLVLEIRGERLEVKTAVPFDGETAVENQGTKAIDGPDWK
jgi:hypothetical protein